MPLNNLQKYMPTNTPISVTREITLRHPGPEDLDMLFRWENDPQQWHNSLSPNCVSRMELWNFLGSYTPDIIGNQQLRFMVDSNGETVGTVDICDYNHRNHTAFVSIYLRPDSRGRGVGSKALAHLLDIAHKYCKIEVVGALIVDGNIPSHRLFEKFGFKKTGTLPAWVKNGGERANVEIFALVL